MGSSVNAFTVSSIMPPRRTLFDSHTNGPFQQSSSSSSSSHRKTLLSLVPEDDNDDANVTDNFDASGFGGYLAPYALALVASVAVTGAFVKFVLLDY